MRFAAAATTSTLRRSRPRRSERTTLLRPHKITQEPRRKPNHGHQAKYCTIFETAQPGSLSERSPFVFVKREISPRCILYVCYQMCINPDKAPFLPFFSKWVSVHYKASTKTFFFFLQWEQKAVRPGSNQGIQNGLELEAKKKKKES